MSNGFQTPYGELPRTPDAYRITDHFRYRFKHRPPPKPTGAIINSCITNGTAKETHMEDRFIFDDDSFSRLWRLVVAWDSNLEEWRAITIFSPDAHDIEDNVPAPV